MVPLFFYMGVGRRATGLPKGFMQIKGAYTNQGVYTNTGALTVAKTSCDWRLTISIHYVY